MLNRIKREVYLKRLRKVQKHFKSKTFNHKDLVVISGTPRGGTTWVNELVNMDKDLFGLWEPLHPFNLKDYYGGENRFWFDKYLPSKEENEELKRFLSELIKGNIISESLLSNNEKFKSYEDCQRLAIKFCRLNEILPWFKNNFPDVKVLQVDRNPFAVISSQMKHGAWNISEEVINEYKKRSTSYCFDFYHQFNDIIQKIETPEEFLAVQFCLSVIPRLNVKDDDSFLSVKYEDLVLNPIKEYSNIYDFFNINIPSNLETLVRRPSSTTKAGSNVLDNYSQQLITWKKHLNSDQTNRIKIILEEFGFNQIGEIEYTLESDLDINYF